MAEVLRTTEEGVVAAAAAEAAEEVRRQQRLPWDLRSGCPACCSPVGKFSAMAAETEVLSRQC